MKENEVKKRSSYLRQGFCCLAREISRVHEWTQLDPKWVKVIPKRFIFE